MLSGVFQIYPFLKKLRLRVGCEKIKNTVSDDVSVADRASTPYYFFRLLKDFIVHPVFRSPSTEIPFRTRASILYTIHYLVVLILKIGITMIRIEFKCPTYLHPNMLQM